MSTVLKRSEEPRPSPSLLGSLKVDPEKGTVTAVDERFLIIPVRLINSMEDRLVRNFGPANATIFEYEIGKESGAAYMELAMRRGLKPKTSEDVRSMVQQAGSSGWGRMDVIEFDFSKKLARMRWTNSVSVRNTKGKTPVCHFNRGLLTGATEVMLGRPCESLEVSCQGKGDKHCEAVIGDPKLIADIADKTKP